MKKHLVYILLSCLIILSLLLSSCGLFGSSSSETTNPTVNPGNDLNAILSKADGIQTMKFEEVRTIGTVDGNLYTWWVRGNKRRSESQNSSGETVVCIYDLDAGVRYQYYIGKNIVIESIYNQISILLFDTLDANRKKLNYMGNETIGGIPCYVYESDTKTK